MVREIEGIELYFSLHDFFFFSLLFVRNDAMQQEIT